MLILVLTLHKEHCNGWHVVLHCRCNCGAPWEAAHDWPLCQACSLRRCWFNTTVLSASEAPKWYLGNVLSYASRLALVSLLQACRVRIYNEKHCKCMSAIKNWVVLFGNSFWIEYCAQLFLNLHSQPTS
jgi:hypothetical protein